jgi:hypothetical protein
MCLGQAEVSGAAGAEIVSEVCIDVRGASADDVIEGPSCMAPAVAAFNNSSGLGVTGALHHGHGLGDSAAGTTYGGGVAAKRCAAGSSSIWIGDCRSGSDG